MYSKEVIIPEEVKIEVENNRIKISGPKGELEREFKTFLEIKIEKVENKLVVSSEFERRKIKSMVGTIASHVGNMIKGVTKGFTYKLKIIYSHFPVKVNVEGDKILIQNFLGEKLPRIAKIVGNVEVKVEGPDVVISGINRENVGQTSANIEQATRIKGYDRKVFMDGIYIASRE